MLQTTQLAGGPLAGYVVVEMAGLGPCPFAGMVLADLGADVIRVERARPGSHVPEDLRFVGNPLDRGKRSIAVDVKRDEGRAIIMALCGRADALIEGYRPGVMERLGLGPTALHERQPGLVYGRMTGWGQSGPLSSTAGHDINYIALAGGLGTIGRQEDPPPPPLNLVGDFGGGGMLLAVGVLAALLQRMRTGVGEVVDAAMVDGTSLLLTMVYGMLGEGAWRDERQSNLLDGAAPFYRSYRCSDGRFVAIGALEPQFYRTVLERLDLEEDPTFAQQYDRRYWPEMHRRFEEIFVTQDRQHWEDLFAQTDGCVSPVLSLVEAADHPHARERKSYLEISGVRQPAPAPRFANSSLKVPSAPVRSGTDTRSVLLELGYSESEVSSLVDLGIVSTDGT